MSNPNPVQNKKFRDSLPKPVDGLNQEKFHRKSFTVKLPMSYAELMLQLDTKERTKLMRSAIIEKLDRLNQPKSE